MDDLLNKLTPVESVKKCAVAYSGGLDSTLGIELLKRIYQAETIVPITVNVGQGAAEIDLGIRRAAQLGIEPQIIDAREVFGEWLKTAIQANSDYQGYPVATSMTRQLIASIIGREAQRLGCDSILEGSTGRGNDQYRMHNVFKMFAPELKVLVPVRDFDLTRTEELGLCRIWGVPVEEVISGGDDKTLWCRSIASGAVGLDQELPDDIWFWLVTPEKAPDRPILVQIGFEKGIPTHLNGERYDLISLIEQLNDIAGGAGIGRIDIFEDGIMGLKSREIYEAPAAGVLLKLKADLEAQCLTKEEREFKRMVDARWGHMVYHGQWFHPLMQALGAFIRQSQETVNGTVTARLYKGNIDIVQRNHPTGSLFFPEIRSIAAGENSFDQRWCSDAAKVMGLPFEILAKRENKIGERV